MSLEGYPGCGVPAGNGYSAVLFLSTLQMRGVHIDPIYGK
ncbi:protein of unknown function [Xenorhabdus poinarii G6]|uniref:Uncharacterized protein n=1 Tax=Xenorhabdus poinarii G6 TaxID=1354304 RepID=A0A068R5U7_9GAMM|nr:protein of unknown function [Xenorhabdus poinarii G6]